MDLSMPELFSALSETGLKLQSLILLQRAAAQRAGDDEAAQHLTEQFRAVNTHTRSLDRDDTEQLRATIQDWQQRIDELEYPQGGSA